MSAIEDVAKSVAGELLRQAIRLAGEELHSILTRGSAGNDSATADRVREILAEESASARALRKIETGV